MEILGDFDLLPKKEVLQLKATRDKLENNLGGIKNMRSLPGCLFVVDLKNEDIATGEFDKKNNTLKLVRNNGEIIGVDLSPLMNDGLKLENYHFAGTDSCSGDCTDKNVFDFKYTTKDKDANGDPIEKKFKIEFSDVDGKLWVTDSDNNKHLIGTFETDKTKKNNKDKINMTKNIDNI